MDDYKTMNSATMQNSHRQQHQPLVHVLNKSRFQEERNWNVTKVDFTKMFKRIVKVEDIATTKILVSETLLICKSTINYE